MPVYRGGWGHREAKAKFIRELPVSVKNDASVLWGEKSVNRQTLQLTDKLPGDAFIHGDYLIYGWKPFTHLAALCLVYALSAGIVNLLLILLRDTPPRSWFWDWEGIALLWGTVVVCALYAFILPYDRYVVFDRRNQLVHIPRWFSRKQDSVRWSEADFGIIDIRLGMFWNERGTNLYVVKPPHSLLHQGYFSYATAICIHEESKQWHEKTKQGDYVNGAESVFRFIVDFMTKPPERTVALDYVIGMDMIQEERNCTAYYPLTYRFHFMWLSLDCLSTQPNWQRDETGQWKQLSPGVIARAGWLGLWGKGMYGKYLKLLPHLRGTRSDPEYHNDPQAPLPGSRWVSVEDGGTGELIDQPPEVIRAILMGEGMPSKESLDSTRIAEGGWSGKTPNYNEWYHKDD